MSLGGLRDENMKRDLYKEFVLWKNESERKPLVIRGARQTGKTWLTRYFGKNEFENFVEVNFEFKPHYKSCFSTLDPSEIIEKIELTDNVSIISGKTLLFLDEIQECPSALKALRYFYEKMPYLHVIAAGSLLEFVMDAEKISMPVGRIRNFYLKPLSFGEFLSANDENKIRSYLINMKVSEPVPESIHLKCIDLLKKYLYIGGMPEAVAHYRNSGSLKKIDETHQALLQNYRHDFGKYGISRNYNLMETVFMKAPGLVGSKFKYSNISRDHNSRDIKKSLASLIKAGVINKIDATSGSGLPLSAHCSGKKFKLLFLDVGLLQNSMGISRETFLSDNLIAVYKGLVAEQFAGQSFLAIQEHYKEPSLFYWHREKKGSSAEVDYVWQYGENILPIEIKSGKTGTLKSLRLFLSEKKAAMGVRFSLYPLSYNDSVLSIPLYAIEALPGLLKQVL